jgi:hypothetical protein
MINQNNSFNLKCIICGRPLILGQVGHRNQINAGVSTRDVGIGGSNEYNLMVARSLACPSGHNYSLNEIDNFDYNELQIEESMLNAFKTEAAGKLTMTGMFNESVNKVYVVNYGFLGRLRVDRLHLRSAPSPSNRVLDRIKIFICTKNKNSLNYSYIFSCVPEKVPYSLNKWKYKVVYYDTI